MMKCRSRWEWVACKFDAVLGSIGRAVNYLIHLALAIFGAGMLCVSVGCEGGGEIRINIGEPSGPITTPATPCDNGVCPLDRNAQPPRRANISVNIPIEMRERNYAGGSCVHASTETTLRYQGYTELAAWWRQTYSGGEHASGLESKLESAGLQWASTNDGDPEFLEWVNRTRRTSVIFYKPAHAINFIQYEAGPDGREYAVLLDNNHPDRLERVEKQQFLSEWRNRYSGFSATIVGTPPPPDIW